ncbi:sp110 nuclear body protein isoform X1 [Tenrec ecaudatus]|uniref:sp110 nuclear body protein isoform X1 n=1 Tax=Tenrec ecaudatus TaxID=94439 RepID=UPI003F59D008
MFPVTKALKEALLQHFLGLKLEIAYAIHKPFPFFESLRDKSLITERMYMESLEACQNLVPVSRVVHNILTQMERTFDLSLLMALFSPINLREYPNLMKSFRSFKRVASANLASKTHDGEDSQALSRLPPGPVQGSSSNQTFQIKDKEDWQDLPSASPGPVQVVKEDSPEPNVPEETPKITDTPPTQEGKKRKRSVFSTPKKRQQKKIQKKATGGWRSETARIGPCSQGAASLTGGIQEKRQVVDHMTQMKDNPTNQSKTMTRAQKTKTDCVRTPEPEETNANKTEMKKEGHPQETPHPPRRIRHERKRKRFSWSHLERRKKISLTRETASPALGIPEKLPVLDEVLQMKKNSSHQSKAMTRLQRTRTACAHTPKPEVSERPEDEAVGFHSLQLPVTCGEANGVLHTERLKRGPSEKCIQDEKGAWFTPREFEVAGKRAKSKKWKRSVLCRGQSLGQLLEKGLLCCPSRESLKKEAAGQHVCEVCCQGGRLLSCDTCSRAFHQDCHVPPCEAQRSPWSCTFCGMKGSSGSSQCLQDSEILEKQMPPADQLIRDYGEPFREAMWLDLVKERLTKRVYSVSWFVRDMRLIFRNHKTFYKTSDFGKVGLHLEAEFEKALQEVLCFHEDKEKSPGSSVTSFQRM